ncbi:hypothetical protein CIHG_04754 [Coccidioides immitis H538.4]|uniref:Uncharacterized protein n=1 Tax=Coccidioides immitis H538.4 TaxID=396776 RepID=A0A0J8RTL8_COCIT|nr:hypothetical protein CIHG_04754 [Coccidioides immitis H538.4]
MVEVSLPSQQPSQVTVIGARVVVLKETIRCSGKRGDDRSPENDLGRVPVTTKADVPLDEPKIQEPVPDNTSKSPPPAEVPATGYPSPSQPPRISLPIDDDKSDYGDESEAPKKPVPQLNIQDVETAPPSNDKAARATLDPHDHYYDGGYQIDTRRLTVGIRPLPPEDPSDNPEQRANRIRSFYKEYFDESKPQDDHVEDHGPGGADYGPFDPHALRKSGTFTALDFVPPPRFKNADSGSDAGSIRSNRTGLSAAQSYSIRTGAYRISRLPPQTVGTKDDIISNLRPTWDMKT